MLDGGGAFSSLVIGAPDFVNAEFVRRWITGADWPVVTLDPDGVRAVYVLDEHRVFWSYVIGAPNLVNARFVTRWIISDLSGPPATPSDLRATKVDIPLAPDDIWVSWSPVPGATSYEVFHSPDEAFSFEASVAEPGYLDETPVFLGPDSYRVRACNTSGCSDFSASVTEGEGGFIVGLLDALPALGLNPVGLCTRLVSEGVAWLLAAVAPEFLPLSSLVGQLLADELGCQ